MNQLPSRITADEDYGLPTIGMAPGLALMFNDRLFERCKAIATYMAKADGITPPHLLGKSEACFFVVTRSITWKLDPGAVALATYQTPGGKIGFEGKLVQAIIENSGKLKGGVSYRMIGDWDKVRGKHKKAQSQRGHEYYVPDWKPEDEQGLGVIVSAHIAGELEPREGDPVMLSACWPRNSTLWALRPEQQIKYLACRAYANTVVPGILMGVPFSTDDLDDGMVDVTPKAPRRQDFAAPAPSPYPPEPTAEGVGHDPETGEIAEADPVIAAARELGRADRKKGIPLKDFPQPWKDEGDQVLIDARAEGWREADAEIRAKLKG